MRIKKSRAVFIGIFIIIIIIGLLLVHKPATAEASLDKKSLGLINKAVFEVVVLKPTKDSLTYERPLPLDLLPYSERTDKYQSLGTAFAISPTEFVSAAHVLSLGRESQFKDYYLRDVNGAVYDISKILKYSERRDFVVFSVKDRPPGEFLPINTTPELNDKVYAVGNALGEGIVIRDGLYTSTTPEEFNGEWKWLRFSAAASPGNSGGPLLDETGKVIGIVLQKSPNENLNIALPIAEVKNAKEGIAHIHRKMQYFLDNMNMTKIDTLQQEIALPKPYQQLNEEITAIVEQFSAKLLDRLFSENRTQIFPNGRESLPLQYKSYDAIFPHLIARGADGIWDAMTAKETRDLELGNNGFLTLGLLGNSILMYIQKPDDIPLEQFYVNSKTFMDTLLKGLGVSRQVGIDKIKVTSFGKARQESVFTDAYQRKWLVRTWSTEYNDEQVVTFSLPVPGGCITMMRGGKTGFTGGHIMDLKALTDFVYVSYYGSLKQWREFLTMKKLLPQAFSTIGIDFDYGKEFIYKSRRLAFSVDQKNMAITEKSDLKLNFGYFTEDKRTAWDVKEIVLGEDKNSAISFFLSRNTRPPSDIRDKYKSEWEKMVGRKMPYNKTSFFKDKSSVIATVYSGNIPEGKLEAATVLYHLGYMKEGTHGQKEMEGALESLMKNITVFEDGALSDAAIQKQ